MKSILINDTTKEERKEYIKSTYKCISNCDLCGICKIFIGKDPEIVFADYIEGHREYADIAHDFREEVN